MHIAPSVLIIAKTLALVLVDLSLLELALELLALVCATETLVVTKLLRLYELVAEWTVGKLELGDRTLVVYRLVR